MERLVPCQGTYERIQAVFHFRTSIGMSDIALAGSEKSCKTRYIENRNRVERL